MNMDNKQKQIEQMAKDLEQAKYWAMGTVGSLNNGFGGWYGTYMYNQGYRKQSDTVREFVEKVLKIGSKRPLCVFNEYGEGYIDCTENIKKIAKEYGVEVKDGMP